jgi:GH15 family glucan-1,4-alpha-glucosidase
MAQSSGRKPLGIEDYGLIGDMHTCALVGIDGSIDFCCWPTFDSPSLFARVLDTTAGGCGYWSIKPTVDAVVKQNYLPATNILQTKWINQDGVVQLQDFFVVRKPGGVDTGPTLVRRIECIRGHMAIEVELALAPNYAKNRHSVDIGVAMPVLPSSASEHTTPGICQSVKCVGPADKAASGSLAFDVQLSPSDDDEELTSTLFKSSHGVPCDIIKAKLTLTEGQRLTMVLHNEKWSVGTIRPRAS